VDALATTSMSATSAMIISTKTRMTANNEDGHNDSTDGNDDNDCGIDCLNDGDNGDDERDL